MARYLLFWGVPTNVGQVASIRTLEKQIRRLKASEYAELRGLGAEIAQACARPPDCVWDEQAAAEPLAPTLARHADADEHAVKSREDLRLWAAQNLPPASPAAPAARGPGAPRRRSRRYRGHAALSRDRPAVPPSCTRWLATGATAAAPR